MDTALKIKLSTGAKLPEYQTAGSSGADLYALLEDTVTIAPRSQAIIPTGVYVEIPYGYEVQIRSRSGLAARESVMVLNSPGTIDSDYRGELLVILFNHGTKAVSIAPGDRVAQMVVCPVIRCNFETVEELTPTPRGEGRFGHTGKQ